MPKVTTLINNRSDAHSQLDSIFTQMRDRVRSSADFIAKVVAEESGETTFLLTVPAPPKPPVASDPDTVNVTVEHVR